ncbi:glycosyltransferase family 2 protein [Phocaeicola dorei]|nr:glycosyltransferase family 2 protein [Phocaeicola dorei]
MCDTINSVLAQTYSNWELILVDDGSTDSSGEICDTYARKDNRIKVVHQLNAGQASARNSGMDLAKGDYIGFLDNDDFYYPDTVRILESNIEDADADIAAVLMLQDMKTENSFIILIVVLLMYGTIMKL